MLEELKRIGIGFLTLLAIGAVSSVLGWSIDKLSKHEDRVLLVLSCFFYSAFLGVICHCLGSIFV